MDQFLESKQVATTPVDAPATDGTTATPIATATANDSGTATLVAPAATAAPAASAAPAAPAPAAPAAAMPTADRSHETTAAGVPWLAFARHRTAIRERWPVHWDLRVTTDHFSPLDRLPSGATPDSVLDVGATDRRHRPAIEGRFPSIAYRSLDVDRTLSHDYHAFSELDRQFDLVMCLEVLEHVAEDVALGIVRDCVAACRPGGHVFLSVPNCLLPYCQLEFTHRTAFNYQDLAAICRISGLDVVDMTRVARGSARTRWIHRYVFGRWHRFMRTDFCGSITCLARRPE